LGSVWVANAEDGTVDRLDPATGTLRGQPIGIGGDDLSGIAVGFGSVWIADGNAGTITKIDPSLNQTEGPAIQLGRRTVAPTPVFYIAVDSRYVWATYGSQLLRIDPHTTQIKRVNIGIPTGLATGGNTVWVTSSNRLYSYSPETMKEINQLSLSNAASAPVYAHGSLWLIVGNEIQQIDPATVEASNTVPAGGSPASLAAGSGALWAVDYFDGKLTRVADGLGRTSSVKVGDKPILPAGDNLSAVAVGGGATWVAVTTGH
jgi:streptogramin lyase